MPNVLRNLKILEVSSVDRGAGDGVKIMIMKRAEDVAKAWGPDHVEWTVADVDMLVASPDVLGYTKRTFTDEQRQAAEDKGHAMPGGGFPIENVSDLKNAIQAAGRAKDPAAAKAHIKRRAEALGQQSLIPDTWKSIAKKDEIDLGAIQFTKAQETDMTLEELNKLIGDQVSKAITEMSAALPALVTKAVEESVAKAFPPKPKKDGDEDGDADDGDGSEAKKALAIAALPPEVRKVFDEAETNAKTVKKFMAERELEEFGKRAVGMGLKKEDGVLMQKAYGGDAAAQKAFEERMATVTKARNAQDETAVIFSEFGSNNSDVTKGATAYDQLLALADELRKKDTTLTQAQAFVKVSTDPANRELAMRESRERLAKVQRLQVN
jgi:hypothetical protein